MGHHTCCNKQKVKRGLWSPDEDEKLINYISTYGHGCWSSVPRLAGLQRCGKSCRLRWINYLRPDLKRGSFSHHEATLIIELHRVLGNRWAQIAKHLPGRTDNEVKNFWNSSIKKRLISAHHHQKHNSDHLTSAATTTTLISPNLANSSSGSSSSSERLYFLNNTNNNLIIPNPQMDQICIPITPPTALQGFDPIEARFEQVTNFHANNITQIMPPSNSMIPFSYLPNSWPNLACNPQYNIIPQNQHQYDENFLFGSFDILNSNHHNPIPDQNSKPEIITQTYNIDHPKGVDQFVEHYSSAATQEYLLEEIAGLSGFSNGNTLAGADDHPPNPMDYVESLMASFPPPSPISFAGSAAFSPPPAASSSFTRPPSCNSNSFLLNPSLPASIWAPQP